MLIGNARKLEQWLEEDFTSASPASLSKPSRRAAFTPDRFVKALDRRDELLTQLSKSKGKKRIPSDGGTASVYKAARKTPKSAKKISSSAEDCDTVRDETLATPKPLETDCTGLAKTSIAVPSTPKSALTTAGTVSLGLRHLVLEKSVSVPVSCSISEETGSSTDLNSCAETAAQTRVDQSSILKDVVAFVDVRTGADNRTEAFQELMKNLGAKVVTKLGPTVTHVIFKEGLKTTFVKAKKLGVPLVSTLWVKACSEQGMKVPDSQYAPINLERYESPFFPSLRKQRSMQPRPLEVDLEYATMLQKKRLQRLKKKNPDLCGDGNVTQKETTPEHEKRQPLSTLQILQAFSPGTPLLSSKKKNTVVGSDSESEYCTPLVVRLYENLLKESEQKKQADEPQEKALSGIKPLDKTEEPSLDDSFTELTSKSNRSNDIEKSVLPTEKLGEKRKSDEMKKPTAAAVNKRRRLFAEARNSVITVPKTPDEKRYTQSQCPEAYSEVSLLKDPTKQQFCALEEKLKLPKKVGKSKALSQLPQVSKTKTSEEKCSEIAASEILQEKVDAMSKKATGPSGLRREARRCKSRKSTEDFKLPRLPAKCKSLSDELPSIVCTSLHSDQSELVHSVVSQLGGFRIVKKPDYTTSHIICGSPRRTLNLLQGLVRGCWIVSFSWVLESVENRKWVEEEPFEMTEFSNLVTILRTERQTVGPKYRVDLFESVGPIYVSKNSKIPAESLNELLHLTGGIVVDKARVAKVILGSYYRNESSVCVDPVWVLDCIQKNQLLCFDPYKIVVSS